MAYARRVGIKSILCMLDYPVSLCCTTDHHSRLGATFTLQSDHQMAGNRESWPSLTHLDTDMAFTHEDTTHTYSPISPTLLPDLEPPKLLFLFFAEFGILKWNFHVLFPVYFNVNYWNKIEFYVKLAIFSIIKWNFQNINAEIGGFY